MKYKPFKFLLLVILVPAFVLVDCSSDDTDASAPIITSFSPTSGIPGQTVVITGKNFSSSASDNFVVFDETTPATVTGVTATTLSVKVPSGATTGKIRITVNGKTAVSSEDFIVLSPSISSFTPAHGVAGTVVTLNGNHFSTTKSDNVVDFNGTTATVESATETELTVTVPEGATTGKINLSLGGDAVSSQEDFEVLKDIPRTGLVAFYPFSGNANDDTSTASNGTLAGGVTLSTDRFGMTDQSYLFNGADGKITIGNPAELQISNAITIAGWINIHAYKTGGNKMQAIITKIFFDPNQGGNPTRGYHIGQDFTGGGTASFSAQCFSTEGLVLSNYVGGTIDLSEWIFIALTIDDKTWKFYQNGEFTHGNTGSATILDDGTQGDLIFGSYGGGFFFDGSIDDVTIYNRAVSADEVLQLYNQTVTKY